MIPNQKLFVFTFYFMFFLWSSVVSEIHIKIPNFNQIIIWKCLFYPIVSIFTKYLCTWQPLKICTGQNEISNVSLELISTQTIAMRCERCRKYVLQLIWLRQVALVQSDNIIFDHKKLCLIWKWSLHRRRFSLKTFVKWIYLIQLQRYKIKWML